MPNPSPYDKLAAQYPRFRSQFRRRVQRGDSLADLAFWVRTQYGVRVSHEAVRQWKRKHLNKAA